LCIERLDRRCSEDALKDKRIKMCLGFSSVEGNASISVNTKTRTNCMYKHKQHDEGGIWIIRDSENPDKKNPNSFIGFRDSKNL
jgi:hypothetical protein